MGLLQTCAEPPLPINRLSAAQQRAMDEEHREQQRQSRSRSYEATARRTPSRDSGYTLQPPNGASPKASESMAYLSAPARALRSVNMRLPRCLCRARVCVQCVCVRRVAV
jgi:hypothetical protein